MDVFTVGTGSWANGASGGNLVSGAETAVPLDYGDVVPAIFRSHNGVEKTCANYMRRGGRFTDLVFTTSGLTMTPDFDPSVHHYT